MKQVAKSITDLTRDENVSRLLDRSQSFDVELLRELRAHWRYDLYSRRPGPALLEDGELKPTDLDLACFLSALIDRGAVLNLPRYTSQRPKMRREGERVVSATNRHGRAVGLSANKECFSFSLRILDQNVVTTAEDGSESTGVPRNFMLVAPDGEWSTGWRSIEFVPSAKENAFLTDKRLWTDNTVYFDNFVHPNRWTAFYGRHYILTKLVIDRLEQENSHMRSEIKRLLAAGVAWPVKGEEGAKVEWPKSTHDTGVATKVTAFEAEVDAPWSGEFPAYYASQAVLVELDRLVRLYTYTTLPELRLATRATELAFTARNASEAGFPHWIRGARWERGYVQKGKRKPWNRLVLGSFAPFCVGLALRYRRYEKTEIMSPAGATGLEMRSE